jgi:hypothetical protein
MTGMGRLRRRGHQVSEKRGVYKALLESEIIESDRVGGFPKAAIHQAGTEEASEHVDVRYEYEAQVE